MPCRGKTFSVDHSAPFSQAVRLPPWDLTGPLSEGPLPGFGLVMCRTVKPKLRVCPDTQSCGGVQTQAPSFCYGVSDNNPDTGLMTTQSTRGEISHEPRIECG